MVVLAPARLTVPAVASRGLSEGLGSTATALKRVPAVGDQGVPRLRRR